MPEMKFANPFNHEGMPDEPPRGAVIAYQMTFPMGSGRTVRAGMIYDYVSFRARDGKWYTTSRRAQVSGETWDDLFPRIQRSLVGPIKYVTEWNDLHDAAYAQISPAHAAHIARRAREIMNVTPKDEGAWERDNEENHLDLDDEDDEPI